VKFIITIPETLMRLEPNFISYMRIGKLFKN
jgi:hypothetical protein